MGLNACMIVLCMVAVQGCVLGLLIMLFLLFPPSAVRRHTWFPDILGNSSCPMFTKFGMQVYWVNSLYGIAFGDDSSIAN